MTHYQDLGGSFIQNRNINIRCYVTLQYMTRQDTVYYGTVPCTTVHNSKLLNNTLHYTTEQYITLHLTTVHYATVQNTTLHNCILRNSTLHYTAVHYTLHNTTVQYSTLHTTLNNINGQTHQWLSRNTDPHGELTTGTGCSGLALFHPSPLLI